MALILNLAISPNSDTGKKIWRFCNMIINMVFIGLCIYHLVNKFMIFIPSDKSFENFLLGDLFLIITLFIMMMISVDLFKNILF